MVPCHVELESVGWLDGFGDLGRRSSDLGKVIVDYSFAFFLHGLAHRDVDWDVLHVGWDWLCASFLVETA